MGSGGSLSVNLHSHRGPVLGAGDTQLLGPLPPKAHSLGPGKIDLLLGTTQSGQGWDGRTQGSVGMGRGPSRGSDN